MFNSFWNDDHLPFFQIEHSVAKSKLHFSSYNEEDLICFFVTMPDKFALCFYQFELIVIELGNSLYLCNSVMSLAFSSRLMT